MPNRVKIVFVASMALWTLLVPQHAAAWEITAVEINGELFAGVGMYSPGSDSEIRPIALGLTSATRSRSAADEYAYATSSSFIEMTGDSLTVRFNCYSSAKLGIVAAAANASDLHLVFRVVHEEGDAQLAAAIVTWESRCGMGGEGTGSAIYSVAGAIDLFGMEIVDISSDWTETLNQGSINVPGISGGSEFLIGSPALPARLESNASVHDLDLLGDKNSSAFISIGIKLVDYAPVGIERSSWGGVKSLFR